MRPNLKSSLAVPSPAHGKLTFNVDAAAIAIALLLAVLVRLNLLPHIGW